MSSVIIEPEFHVYFKGFIFESGIWNGLDWPSVLSFITIGSDIQIILSFLPQYFERLLCWYYWWKKFMIYTSTIKVGSGTMIFQVSWRLTNRFSSCRRTDTKQQCDLVSLLLYLNKESRLKNIGTATRSRSHITTDGQSANSSWYLAPFGAGAQMLHLSDNYFLYFSCRAPTLTRGRVCNLQCNDASSI
jgi:hypothetical protein